MILAVMGLRGGMVRGWVEAGRRGKGWCVGGLRVRSLGVCRGVGSLRLLRLRHSSSPFHFLRFLHLRAALLVD